MTDHGHDYIQTKTGIQHDPDCLFCQAEHVGPEASAILGDFRMWWTGDGVRIGLPAGTAYEAARVAYIAGVEMGLRRAIGDLRKKLLPEG